MWILSCDRKILTDILFVNVLSSNLFFLDDNESFPTEPLVGDNIYLIWGCDPRTIYVPPSLIVLADGKLKDFLAWAVTYFPNYRPFTAYFRVFEFSKLSSLLPLFKLPSLSGIETAFIGLIISEASILLSSLAKPVTMTIANCSNTLSYILIRAISLGINIDQIKDIADRWLLCRKITDQPERISLSNEIIKICHILIYLMNSVNGKYIEWDSKDSIYLKSCSEIYNSGRVSDLTWRTLTSNSHNLENSHDHMLSTREERVVYFQKLIMDSEISAIEDVDKKGFILGYLASMIAPGSLAHFELLGRVHNLHPSVRLWYGVCSGLHKNNHILIINQCLGRLILRELLRHEPLLGPPVGYISLDELSIFAGGNYIQNLPPYLLKRLIIEIYPCISAGIVWPKIDLPKNTESIVKSDDNKDQIKLFSELGHQIEKVLDIYKKLSVKKAITSTESKPQKSRKAKSNSNLFN